MASFEEQLQKMQHEGKVTGSLPAVPPSPEPAAPSQESVPQAAPAPSQAQIAPPTNDVPYNADRGPGHPVGYQAPRPAQSAGYATSQQAGSTMSMQQQADDPESKLSALAVSSMVVGIVAVLLSWLVFFGLPLAVTGLGLGIAALVLMKKHPKLRGKGMAWAGVITSGLALIAGIISIIITMMFFSSLSDELSEMEADYEYNFEQEFDPEVFESELNDPDLQFSDM